MNSAKILDTGLSAVYSLPLAKCGATDGCPRALRLEAERLAVAILVEDVFGTSARYSHLPSGAPVIEGSTPVTFNSISVSHGAGQALLAVSGARAVGVDVEGWREQLERVTEKFLSPSQRERYASGPSSLLMAWTAKEALYKAVGQPGLTLAHLPLPVVPGNGEVSIGPSRYRLTFSGDEHVMTALAEKL